LIELDADFIDARLSGTTNLDLHLASDMGSAALPHFGTDVVVGWAFDNSIVAPGDSNAVFGATPTIQFQNVTYDFGSFVDDFIQPILNILNPVLEPINQALAIFRTDISFLKNLPDWQTFLDLAGTVVDGTDAPDGNITLLDFVKLADNTKDLTGVIQFINLIDNIVDWAAFFQDKDFGPDAYNLGNFIIDADIRDTALQIAQAASTFNASGTSLESLLGGLTSGNYGLTDPGSGKTGQQILQEMIQGKYFTFPLLSDPSQALRFLLGGNADLFSLDLPAIVLNFGGGFDANGNPAGSLAKLATKPILPVIPGVADINLNLAGAVSIAMDMAFGFDSSGLAEFKASGYSNYAAVLTGFYLSDQIDASGDLPEAWVQALIELTVSADIPLASIAGGGNIGGLIELNLNDTVNGSPADGKIYLDEFGQALTINPLGLFDASGSITAGFGAYVNVGGYDLWRYYSPRIELISFDYSNNNSTDVEPPPPGLGDLDGSTLLLNIGTRAGERDITDNIDGDESLQVSGSGSSVTLTGFGSRQRFTGVTDISLESAGTGGDEIVLDVNLGLSANLQGGAGIDFLYGGAGNDILDGGSERDYLKGRAGNDTLMGGDGDDILEGGGGADNIVGGTGVDVLSYEESAAAVYIDLAANSFAGGDAQGDTVSEVEIFEGSNYGDTILGSTVADIIIGMAGDDNLVGRDGDDFIAGGFGSDSLDGGTGNDTLTGGIGNDLYMVDSLLDVVDEDLAGPAEGTDRIVASIDYDLSLDSQRNDIEELQLTGSARHGIGNALNNLLIGTDGNDILDGGFGADRLEGGSGNDIYIVDNTGDVISETNTLATEIDTVLASVPYALPIHVENLALTGTENINGIGNELDNVLEGNEGNNQLLAGDGNDTVTVAGGSDSVAGQGGDNDLLKVDYSQASAAVTTDLGDKVHPDGYWTTARTFTDGIDHQVIAFEIERFEITGGGFDDVLITGDGSDTLKGGGGNDDLNSNAGVADIDGGEGTGDRWQANLSALTADQAVVLDLTGTTPSALGDGSKVTGIETLNLRTRAGDDIITTLDSTLDDVILSGDGNDTVTVAGGSDSVPGGRPGRRQRPAESGLQPSLGGGHHRPRRQSPPGRLLDYGTDIHRRYRPSSHRLRHRALRGHRRQLR